MGKFDLPDIRNCMYNHNGVFMQLDAITYHKIQELCEKIIKAQNVRFIFRADGRVDNTYNSSYDSPILAERIFMVGVKGNDFFSVYNSTSEDLYTHGKDVFLKIQESLQNNSGTPKFRHRICDFKLRNMEFVKFFGNNANKEVFAAAFNSRAKWFINDYYEVFLHSLYRNGYRNNKSEYVSTSSDINMAKQFQNSGIIFVGWLPKSGVIPYHNINKRNLRIAELGLPTYDKCAYSYQKEFCLKYGILPHMIIGYLYNDKFIINHHLIENIQRRDIDEIIHDGCEIDQKDFRQVLSETRYKRGYNLTTHQYIS